MLAGIRAAAGPAGAVLMVKNYTGDRLNFGLAAELARAEGIPVEVVVVADDVALHATVPPDRRRGIAGTVLIHKLAGAAAAAGQSLAEVAGLARAAAAELGSDGRRARRLHRAGRRPAGLRARPGGDRARPRHPWRAGGRARRAAAGRRSWWTACSAPILADRGLRAGDRVALLVNGLGGTPPMELAIVARRAIACLREQGLVVERAWAGEFLTALEMPGVSLSVLRLDAARLALLDAPTEAPAWPAPAGSARRGGSSPPAPPAAGRACRRRPAR